MNIITDATIGLLFPLLCYISIAKEGTCILNPSNTLLVLLGASDTSRGIYIESQQFANVHSQSWRLEKRMCFYWVYLQNVYL